MAPMSSNLHGVVVHAHCYQPPREDPWLEVVETELSAAPDHDWNTRINRECYSRLGSVAVRGEKLGIESVINLYAWCSFDVGATLCEWLEAHAPDTLAAMIAGDRASVERWGHGNAIAAPYHHVILPLASPRDRKTEIKWGIADFRKRFGREPEGIWLPECAVDEDTLEDIAAAGIRFTILAPYQIESSVETNGLPVKWRGSRGRAVTILPYDGALAGEVAFGSLLKSYQSLAHRLASNRDPAPDNAEPQQNDGSVRSCTTLATDGETFGHHHRNGESTLARALRAVASGRINRFATILNSAAIACSSSVVESANVRLVSPSAWSCAHGVERWRSNCGCRMDGGKPPSQQWRAPLRESLEALSAACHQIYEIEALRVFRDDPWLVRDLYGEVVGESGATLQAFVDAALVGGTTDVSEIRLRAHSLLELERALLRMFTSCAWFFDDVAGIETRQVLRYAARTIELANLVSHSASRLTSEFVQQLGDARGSNGGGSTPEESAGDVFVRDAVPRIDPAWCAAAAAVACEEMGVPQMRIALYATVCTRPEARQDKSHQWIVSATHQRTFRTIVLGATIAGSGPSTVVTVTPIETSAIASVDIAIERFPEGVARLILSRFELSDQAMYSANVTG